MACSLNMAPKPNLRISTPASSFSGHNVKPVSHSFRHTLHTPKFNDVSTTPTSSSPSSSPSSSSSSSRSCNTRPISAKRQRVVASVLAPPLSTTAIETASYSSSSPSLSHFWREIQGCNDWEELLDPLHPLLRNEIIRYGEFVSACYEAFDLDPNSKRYLNCKHGKKSMLREVGLENSGYEVTKYIYATPDVNLPNLPIGDSCGRWIGYVAVSSDDEVKKIGRRDVLITFRGTVTNPEWMANLMSSLTPARLDPQNPRPDVKVESGFLNLYTADESMNCKFGVKSCREQLLSEVSRLLNMYKGEEMSITLAGHSMGSSLALLFAYDISELGLLNRSISINSDSNSSHRDDKIPVTVFSFGGPRVGNSAFKERCEELGVRVLRIVNVNDPITKVPGVFFNENFRVLGGRYEFPWRCSCYAHVGAELVLDFFNVHNPSCVHDIEFYINLLKHPNMKSSPTEIQKNFDNLVQRAREFVLMGAQNLDMLQWRNAAGNVMNLIPTQRSTTIY